MPIIQYPVSSAQCQFAEDDPTVEDLLVAFDGEGQTTEGKTVHFGAGYHNIYIYIIASVEQLHNVITVMNTIHTWQGTKYM